MPHDTNGFIYFIVVVCVFALIAVGLAITFSAEFELVEKEEGTIFYAEASAYTKNQGKNYTEVWAGAGVKYAFTNTEHFPLGQKYDKQTGWTIYRGLLRFDTTTIPANANITKAKLCLFGSLNFTEFDFIIRVQNWTGGDSVTVDDFTQNSTQFYDNGNFNTTDWSNMGYNEVILSDFSIIQKNGYTCLFLRSESEAMGNECFWIEVVYAYGAKEALLHRPKLIIEFSEGE